MLKSISEIPEENEGYVYTIYGENKYLRYVLASLYTLRRYDRTRPVALVCEENHIQLLEKWGLSKHFDKLIHLHPKHRSIIGFKHNIDSYMVFRKNLFLDCDIIWCKNPDGLWCHFNPHPFTITGNIKADYFFGARKDLLILMDILFNRRKRTLEKFGLTYLSRVQSGMIYAKDEKITKEVCELARSYFLNKDKTHFVSRKLPDGNTEESDEWAFAMALSYLNLPVTLWHNGCQSPQIDYIKSWVQHDKAFNNVRCLIYRNDFVNNLRGVRFPALRRWLIKACEIIMDWGDYAWLKPYSIHFGWKHEKEPFVSFSQQVWEKMIQETETRVTVGDGK